MPNRVIACLLSFVLLWCGIGSQERPQAVDGEPTRLALLMWTDASSDSSPGEVEDHHLDDLPLHADSAGELPGLLSPALLPQGPMPGLSPPPELQRVSLRELYLDGPLRPPRTGRPSA